LRHVEKNQTLIFVRNGCPDAHVPDGGRHHARRKFLGRGMASATVGTEAFFALNARCVGVGSAHYRSGLRRFSG
jgi:hypothetical protein